MFSFEQDELSSLRIYRRCLVVKPAYLRSLARDRKICTHKLGPRTTLYFKNDIDAYKVEDRGTKAALAAKARAQQKGMQTE